MHDINVINVEARDQPIKKVIVFNDRAEVKRLIKVELTAGVNQVHIRNMTQSLVSDSIRVEGRGDGSILEVLRKDEQLYYEKTDSINKVTASLSEIAEMKTRFAEKEKEANVLRDRLDAQNIWIKILDRMVDDIGAGVLPKDNNVTVDDTLSGITKIFSFYDSSSSNVKEKQRETKIVLSKAEEELNQLRCNLEPAKICPPIRTLSKTIVVILESDKGGAVELDLVYLVNNASWNPSYDLRMQSSTENSLKISYFAQVTQTTGEDWVEVPLVLSTAQSAMGGNIPELGTLEASVYPKPQNHCHGAIIPCSRQQQYQGRYQMMGGMHEQMQMPHQSNPMQTAIMPQMPNPMKRPMEHVQVSDVKVQVLSSEFNITRSATIPSKSDKYKVTIGIVDLTPQLIYECVPSKNTSVFLTASSVNFSQLSFLAGPASVYLNGSFIANTKLKSVSPGEKFSCFLGVDAAIRVEYNPAKKYRKQVGEWKSSNVTEQFIKIHNTKNVPVIITVKEQLPRSTDEKIDVRLISPTSVSSEEVSVSVNEGPSAPKKGCRLNGQNNLEWTVELIGGEIRDILFKYAIDHEKNDKIQFTQKQ